MLKRLSALLACVFFAACSGAPGAPVLRDTMLRSSQSSHSNSDYSFQGYQAIVHLQQNAAQRPNRGSPRLLRLFRGYRAGGQIETFRERAHHECYAMFFVDPRKQRARQRRLSRG